MIPIRYSSIISSMNNMRISYLASVGLRLLLIGWVIVTFSACNSRKKAIAEQIGVLYSNPINIPYTDMDTLIVDSVCLPHKARYKIFIYVDSTECSACYASHYMDWEPIVKECRKNARSVALIVIIENKNLSTHIREKFLMANFRNSIFIDKDGAFRKNNLKFPSSTIMHVLLLDSSNKVLLVGNPLNNKNIEELLYSKLRNS